MCGLVGIISNEANLNKSFLDNALLTMEHRGPDGHSTWISKDKSVGLGHIRLAIVGINNGRQPIASEDGELQIIVNGEFYDYERIRSELKNRGHKFSTDTDGEIALHLYEDYGIDCLKHLRGEFAFVIWDNRKKQIFAARDRFGIKPLHYHHGTKGLYLASEAKALFALGVEPYWDSESFFHASHMQYVLPDRTLFQGIKQLCPGHYLLSDGNSVKTYKYWDLNYAPETSDIEQIDENEAIERFAYYLDESVRLRLKADIPVGCHLSGGLDSSAVLGLAAKHSTKPIQCFSVSFTDTDYDELAIAQEMANYAGAVLHPVYVSQYDLLEYLPQAVQLSEGLAVNGHLSAKFLLNKAINKSGYKVMLTGEGSDEVVAGYPHLRSDLFLAQGRSELLSQLHSTNRASQGIMLKQGQSLKLDAIEGKLGYIPSFLEAKGTLGCKMRSILNNTFIQNFSTRDAYSDLIEFFDVEQQLKNRHRVNQSLYLWSKTALANYILRTLGDGVEMANSIEGRLPFLDHHLFEYVRNLPLHLKINDTIEKYILREATKPVITETIYKRQKHPFVAPPVSRFKDKNAYQFLRDNIESTNFESVPFFDKNKINQLLDRLPSMSEEEQAATDPILMTALSASALQERYKLKEAKC